MPYREISRPGVEFRQECVTSIDPQTRHVVTDAGTYEPDILVVALGADYRPGATPGFVEDGYEYYSAAGAERLRDVLAAFRGGRMLIAVLGVPFKCPSAPYEGALLLHEYLVNRGIRDATTIHVISPMDSPVPVSKETSEMLVRALGERDIGYTPGRRVTELDPTVHLARHKSGDIPYDLFIGIPVHRAPAVVEESGLTVGGNDGWVAVDPRNLATPFSNTYALGDCADAPVPRAGVFAETAARAVAEDIAAKIHGSESIVPYNGRARVTSSSAEASSARWTPTSSPARRPRHHLPDHRENWPSRRSSSLSRGTDAGLASRRSTLIGMIGDGPCRSGRNPAGRAIRRCALNCRV